MSPIYVRCVAVALPLLGFVSLAGAADTLSDSSSNSTAIEATPAAVSAESENNALPSGDINLPVTPLRLDAAPSSNQAPAPYKGGRGMITTFGPTGMFMNPTSGTLNQGQLTLQNCEAWKDGNSSNTGYGFLLDYGITDWLDAGGFGEVATTPPHHDKFFANSEQNGGPFARIRILKDSGWIPEVSVGALYIDGYASAYHVDPFIAASKGVEIDPDGILRSIEFHLGYRYRFQNAAPGHPRDEAYVFGGVELELPYSLYVVGEQQSQSLVSQDGTKHTPYAIGLQWKPNNVLGLSVADLDLGDGRFTPYFGVGLNFHF